MVLAYIIFIAVALYFGFMLLGLIFHGSSKIKKDLSNISNTKKPSKKELIANLENKAAENHTEINNLKSENEKLQIELQNYKTMYEKIMDAKDIMSILKILDENNAPELTKEKLSKLWDVLPYYPPDWNIRKWIVKRRDDYTCQKCKKDLYRTKDGEVHHIQPLSIGGTNKINNLILLCHDCHKKLHDEMFNFSFSRDERETLYDDWTYYKIFRQTTHGPSIDSAKKDLLRFDSYKEEDPDTDKYYNISYWENQSDD